MKLFTLIVMLLLGLFTKSLAQKEITGILPAADAINAQFTDWQKVEFIEANVSYSYQYRAALANRKALACNFQVEVQNLSAKPIEVKIKAAYFDGLVKRQFTDDYKAKIKPQKTTVYEIRTQGCKAQKEAVNPSDVKRCIDCNFSYTLKADDD